jgi:hypothetical protein
VAELPAADWDALAREVDLWRLAGRRATLWWRDDDAVAVTPALLELQRSARVPLALAVIPAAPANPLEDALGLCLADWPVASVLQHGIGHVSHAPAGGKNSEFPSIRPLPDIRAGLAAGLARLSGLFGARFLPVLTPPWNRIANETLPLLPGLGFRGLSRFDDLPYGRERGRAAGVHEINTQVDVIDWRGSRGFVGEAAALGRLVSHLAARRTGLVEPELPTGILTHHLVHDTATWRFLENLQDWLARRGELELFLDPRTLWPPL